MDVTDRPGIYGTLVDGSCKTGHALNGSENAETRIVSLCTSDAVWNDTTPCVREYQKYKRISGSKTTRASTSLFVDKRFGNANKPISISGKKCPRLTIVNSTVIQVDGWFETEVTVDCIRGHTADEQTSYVTTCTPDAQWDPLIHCSRNDAADIFFSNTNSLTEHTT